MSLIIVATDFSAVGDHAVIYACELAAARKSELLVIHTFIMPVMFTDIPVPNNFVNNAQNDSESQLQQLLKDLDGRYPDLVIRGKAVYGDVVDAINGPVEEKTEPWLVIIGNNNKQEAISIDSTLMETLKHAKYPVLAVPPGAVYTGVKNICFAFDNNHKGSEKALAQLTVLQQELQAQLHILIARPDVQNHDNNANINEASRTLLAPANPQYHFRYDTSIENTIMTFIDEQHTDWLAVMPRRHSFFDGLFHKSHSKAMAHEVRIPILSLQERV
jgi:nucleotide-binding universal stress UspA family protein